MEQRVSRLEGAYEQVDARLHDITQSVESLRAEMNARFAEMNSRINTLMIVMIGSWITVMLAIIGLYFAQSGR